MKQTVVILTNNTSETYWAVSYLSGHKHENVIILTSNIEGQLILRRNNLPWDSIYSVESFDMNKSTRKDELEGNVFKKSFETIKEIELENSDFKIYESNIIRLAANNLAFIYPDIFHGLRTYKRIISKWKPMKIYISASVREMYITGNKDSLFSLACYIRYYFKHKEIKVICYTTFETKIYQPPPVKKFLYLAWLVILKYFYLLVNFGKIKIRYGRDKKNILMQTGGIITSYYYKLYRELSKSFNFTLVLYKLQLHQQIPLFKMGIPFIRFETLWQARFNNELQKQSTILLNKVYSLSVSSLPDSNLKRAILSQTQLFLLKNIEQIVKRVIIQKELINRYQSDLVINSHDPSIFGSSLVLQAKIRKIPTLLLLHGLHIEDYILEHNSDYFAVWGKETKRYFKKRIARDPKTIIALGFTKFDEYKDIYRKIKPLYPQTLTAGIKIGLFLNSHFPSDSYQSKFFFEFFEVISRLKVKPIINYRFHEGFNTAGINILSRYYGIMTQDCSDWELINFIKSNDIIISWDTTALLWVMLYGKPLIHTSPVWRQGALALTQKYKAAYSPQNPTELEKILNEYISNPNSYKKLNKGQRNFIYDTAGKLDGRSSIRLLNLIKKLTA